jgi:V/A-type H+-transporting ATPase subunit K
MNLGLLAASLVFGLAAIGSGIGIMIGGMATIGAWKKCYINKKAAPMTFLAFAGNPLSQTIYGFILMGQIMAPAMSASPDEFAKFLGLSLAGGVALLATAVAQGKLAACAVEAIAETGKGFAQFMIIMGIAETVALFAMVLTMTSI